MSGRSRSGGLAHWVGALAVVAAAATFGAANRRELPPAWRVLRSAQPAWVAAAVGCTVVWFVAYGLVHRNAQRAAGLVPAPAGELAPVVVAAHFCNLVTKSGAMAGLVMFDRLGRRRGQPRGRVVAAYLLAGLVGDLAFGAVLSLGLVLVWIDGRLTPAEVGAGAVFAVVLAVRLVVLAAAVGDRGRARRLVAAPARWRARRRHRDPAGAGEAGADELHDAVRLLRERPAAIVPAVIAGVGVEATGIALLWVALAAVGAPHSLVTAVVGYAISVLFAIVGFLPGGLGFVEASLGAVLVSSGVGPATAAAAVALYRLFELWLPAAVGAVAAQLVERSTGHELASA